MKVCAGREKRKKQNEDNQEGKMEDKGDEENGKLDEGLKHEKQQV